MSNENLAGKGEKQKPFTGYTHRKPVSHDSLQEL